MNSTCAAVDLATNGLGIAKVTDFALGCTVEDGDLVTVLNDCQSENSLIGAVYLGGRTLPRKVRALIDFSAKEMKSLFSGN